MALDISEVAAQRSFVFLWCGSSDGLDLGRLCLQHWGFRRCEDICWIQTNHKTGKVYTEKKPLSRLDFILGVLRHRRLFLSLPKQARYKVEETFKMAASLKELQ